MPLPRRVEHEFDVLVIGAGGAGLRAALAAAEEGARVAVAAKSLLGKSQTAMGAALAAALGTTPQDSPDAHFADTMRGGRGVNQPGMARLLADEIGERVRELESWGALFGRDGEGRIRLGEGSGHRYARLARSGQHNTGLEMLRTLQFRLAMHGIALFAECPVVELLKDGARVAGAFGFRRDGSELLVLQARSVVLATGGGGKLYPITSNFYDATGDGYALALRAGAELIDMEFVQFHPTGMVTPRGARGLLVAESIRNLGGVMRNAAGERFLFGRVPESYRAEIAETEAEAELWYADPSRGRRPPELLPRDELSRAIESEIRAGGGTPEGGVLLDISMRPPERVKAMLGHMHRQFLELAGLDITRSAMEVAPTCHYMMGGVRVDAESGESTVEGLYAAGEAAGGLHGANRLNGNGMSELLVFGRRAGRHAARHARAAGTIRPPTWAIEKAERALSLPLEDRVGENPYALQRELQERMQASVALLRHEPGLRECLRGLARWRERAREARARGGLGSNPALQCCLDLRSLGVVAEAVARSALARRETRGAHLRADFPRADPAFEEGNVVVRIENGEMQARLQARSPQPVH